MTTAIHTGERGPVSVSATVIVAVMALVLVVAHAGTILDLVERWSSRPEYSHGFLIPIISGWLLWNRREAISRSLGRPSWNGVALVAASCVFLVGGELTDTTALNHAALLMAIVGLVLSLGGWSLLRVTFVPIAFLSFMIPLPYLVSSTITLRLQLISSELGVAIIRACSVPVYLEGNIIDLGAYKLGIVEACSGLRYLIPFLGLGFIGVYVFRGPLWQKILIFLAVFPITIIMNSARIAMIGVVSQFVGISYAEGILHYFEGWLVFVACIAILYAVMVAFAVINRDPTPSNPLRIPDVRPALSGGVQTARFGPALIASMALLLATAVYVQAGVASGRSIPDRAKLIGLPYEHAEWNARIRSLTSDVEAVLAADDYVVADLYPRTRDAVNLYVAQLDYQRDDRSWHSPQQCIPGGGWTITNLTRTPVELDSGRTITVNRVEIEKNSVIQLVYYWYRQRGRDIASEWSLKYLLLADAVTRNRTDGAMVRLTTPVFENEPIANADRRLRGVLEQIDPLLPKYIPD